MAMTIELNRTEIYNEELSSTKSQGSRIICYISTMSTKVGKKVTYFEKLPTIKSHKPFNSWSREIT